MSKIMKGVNAYFKELSAEEIENKDHRRFVGGLWEELGELQLNFLLAAGMKPEHYLLDVGCGSLRGGVHYIKYLQQGHYYGLDINQSLIDAGHIEVAEAGLTDKAPNLLVDDKFSFEKFQRKFDYMVSVSVFTHLPLNIIVRCLSKARDSLAPNGVYYATFFEAPHSAHIERIQQQPGGITTNYDADPFHYSAEELQFMAKIAGLELDIIGDWNHPRNQRMAAFRLP